MMGAGSISCAEYGKEYQRDPAETNNLFFSWAQGFWSGMNVAQSGANKKMRNLAGLTISDQLDRLRLFCDQRPLLPFAAAAKITYEDFPLLP